MFPPLKPHRRWVIVLGFHEWIYPESDLLPGNAILLLQGFVDGTIYHLEMMWSGQSPKHP